MKDILRRFCTYGMEYKDHEDYTHDWVTLLLAVNWLITQLRKNNIISRGGTNHTWNLNLKKGNKWKNAVEVKLTEEFSRKHPVFPVSLVKPYFQTEENRLPSRKKNPTPPDIVEVEDSPGPVKKIIKARKIRLNGKDKRQYLVRFKNQTCDKDKWLAEDAIPDENLHLNILTASRRTEKSHQ
ncbi:hypothetical protein O181_052747 [Austropuccinia psidii MF-1]|uniref:Chromo domain-containing protein n=1 Tax=Austropuccinia psidii MF-1 TaxID=1389203 RepID=A0A9Q3E8A9_9BASI|nr:hypothetical protein [Austropuccinia psidii MF-1]